MKPAAPGAATVRFITAAPTPEAGMLPGHEDNSDCRVVSPAILAELEAHDAGLLRRVSNIRNGVTGLNVPASAASPAAYQPATSATRSTVPPDRFFSFTLPSLLILTVTWFGIVSPGPKHRFATSGASASAGYAVMQPGADGLTAVTFMTTAPAPEAGTPPKPATGTVRSAFGCTRACGTPVPN